MDTRADRVIGIRHERALHASWRKCTCGVLPAGRRGSGRGAGGTFSSEELALPLLDRLRRQEPGLASLLLFAGRQQGDPAAVEAIRGGRELSRTGEVSEARAQNISRGPLTWKEIERQAIQDALDRNAGNRTHAARQLRISLSTLQYRLKEYFGEEG